MVRISPERILLVGDSQRQLASALVQAMPAAHVTAVPDVFDAIAELSADSYTAVVAAAEPIERRPETAVRTLRQVAGDARVILFGHPTLEPLSRKMLDFGCDDYVITPASPAELLQIFASPAMRTPAAQDAADDSQTVAEPPPSRISVMLSDLPLAEILLDAMLQSPHDALGAVVKQINARLAPAAQLLATAPGAALPPAATAGNSFVAVTSTVRSSASNADVATLHLLLPHGEDEAGGRHLLSQLGHLLGKVGALQDRHNGLQKLAITDELTGAYNGRYFRHFLARIIERARVMRFPVTLLLFDIDNFKKYNDQFGHGVGDEILKQTALLMRRCCRDHDLVARIGGDEFAVVFWEKEGPRQPRDPKHAGPSRPPQTPLQILERFRRLIATETFKGLGPHGQGTLTISGGLAVFPYEAPDPETLIKLADDRLVFGAKRSGKNTIFLVGSESPGNGSPAAGPR